MFVLCMVAADLLVLAAAVFIDDKKVWDGKVNKTTDIGTVKVK